MKWTDIYPGTITFKCPVLCGSLLGTIVSNKDLLHNWQEPVQKENARPLVQIFRISRWHYAKFGALLSMVPCGYPGSMPEKPALCLIIPYTRHENTEASMLTQMVQDIKQNQGLSYVPCTGHIILWAHGIQFGNYATCQVSLAIEARRFINKLGGCLWNPWNCALHVFVGLFWENGS